MHRYFTTLGFACALGCALAAAPAAKPLPTLHNTTGMGLHLGWVKGGLPVHVSGASLDQVLGPDQATCEVPLGATVTLKLQELPPGFSNNGNKPPTQADLWVYGTDQSHRIEVVLKKIGKDQVFDLSGLRRNGKASVALAGSVLTLSNQNDGLWVDPKNDRPRR